jgi:hypothetical protein
MEVWVVPFAHIIREGKTRRYEPDVAVFDNQTAAYLAFDRIAMSVHHYIVEPPKKVKVQRSV